MVPTEVTVEGFLSAALNLGGQGFGERLLVFIKHGNELAVLPPLDDHDSRLANLNHERILSDFAAEGIGAPGIIARSRLDKIHNLLHQQPLHRGSGQRKEGFDFSGGQPKILFVQVA